MDGGRVMWRWRPLLVGILFGWMVLAPLSGIRAVAQEAVEDEAEAGAEVEPASQESQADELARRATDPTASPLTFSLITDVTTDYYDLADGIPVDETGVVLKFQPVIPFKAWGAPNILRMTLPYQESGRGPEGLGDIAIFDLVVIPRSWGRLGVGFVASLASSSREVSSHASAGPAIGFVKPVSPKLNIGLFNQNLFAHDIGVSQIQPIVAYQIGNGWSLAAGDLQFVYDWERSKLVSAPIGVQLGKVFGAGKQAMRWAINPQYNLVDLPGAGRFKVLFTLSILAPGN